MPLAWRRVGRCSPPTRRRLGAVGDYRDLWPATGQESWRRASHAAPRAPWRAGRGPGCLRRQGREPRATGGHSGPRPEHPGTGRPAGSGTFTDDGERPAAGSGERWDGYGRGHGGLRSSGDRTSVLPTVSGHVLTVSPPCGAVTTGFLPERVEQAPKRSDNGRTCTAVDHVVGQRYDSGVRNSCRSSTTSDRSTSAALVRPVSPIVRSRSARKFSQTASTPFAPSMASP